MGNVLSIRLSMSNFLMKKDTQLLLEALKISVKIKPFLMRVTVSSMLVDHSQLNNTGLLGPIPIQYI